jgi:hypothetical protein
MFLQGIILPLEIKGWEIMKGKVSGRATFTELKYSKRRQTYTVQSPAHSEI